MKRILVTGAAGFVGSHLVEKLLERGDIAIGLDNFDTYYDPGIKRNNLAPALTHDHFTLHEVDIYDEQGLTGVFEKEKPDVVVHLAARVGVRPSLKNPSLYHRVNVIGSQHVLDACRRSEPSHLVFASSSSVYGGITETPFKETMDISRPVSPYAATKRMNELMAYVYSQVYGIKVTLLRFFTVYGPRQRPDMAIHKFTKLLSEDKPVPMFGDGSTQRDYTYVDDIIDGVLKAVDTPFQYEIFNLGGHHTTSLAELIDFIAKQVGKPVRVEQQPMQPGDVAVTYADIAKARRMLGYTPTCGVKEGIRRFVDWFKGARSA